MSDRDRDDNMKGFFYSVCWELFVSFWDKDLLITCLQPSLFLCCVPMSHITQTALEQNVQPTDKSSVPSRFCCHCRPRSLNEDRCKTATESRKNVPKHSTESREHQVSAWEIQVHHPADADFCGISQCVLGTYCEKGSRGNSNDLWKSTYSALSMLIYLLFARVMLPWGRYLDSETLWEHPWNLYKLRIWWEHLSFMWLPSSKVS